MTEKYLLPSLIIILFFAACARQSAPTGGPKDTIPPKMITSYPRNEQTNYRGKKIELTFDEYINLNSAKEQVIITPSVGKDYDISSKRDQLTIAINEPLDSNTTYTINFREAVQDITERNPSKDLKLAFSTGAYIDSMTIDGTVTDFIQATPKKDFIIALQHLDDTLSIMKHPAFYFTRSNQKGYFKIDYIKPGIYQLYAFDDKNKNLIVDSRNESYGFFSKPLQLTKDTFKIQIKTLRLDTRPLKVTSARAYNTYFNIKTTKNLQQYEVTSPAGEVSSYYGEDQSNIRIYNTFESADSTAIQLTAKDSLGTALDTIVYAKFRKEADIKKEKFTMQIEKPETIARTGTISATFKFNKPVKEFNLDSVYYQKDSITNIFFSKNDLTYDPSANTIKLQKIVDKKIFIIEETDPGIQKAKVKDTTTTLIPLNQLIIKKGSFISIENDSSAAQKIKIIPAQPNSLSEIHFKIKANTKTNYLIQLLDKQFQIIQQLENQKQGAFKDLAAGEYILRVILDSNNNKRWDPGNYLKKTEPEKITYYTDAKGMIGITLKSNWENELGEMLITD